jgi:hypothetical protein
LDLDRKQVGRKVGAWKAATDPTQITPPDPVRENLPIHFALLSNFLKHEEFELLAQNNPPVADAMKQHVAMIGQMLAQQAQAAQAPPDDRKPVEKGDTSALKGAIDGGALKPGGPPAPADPMQGLLQAGALQPAGGQPAGPSIDDLVAARALTPLPTTGPPGQMSGPPGQPGPPGRPTAGPMAPPPEAVM